MKVIKNKKYAGFSFAALIIAGTLLYIFPPHFTSTNATDYTGTDTATGEWQWQVNVEETLTMTVTPNTVSQTGDPGTFLRNKVGVSVSTNNGGGYTVGMTTKTTSTALANGATDSLPTLSATTKRNAFPNNAWGYSINDTDTGSDTSDYYALVASNAAPITVLSNATNGSGNKNVYFGAKANASKAAGTYTGTVIFSFTSGTKGSALPAPSGNPGTPEGPSAQPGTSEQPSASPSVAEVPSASNTYSYTTGTRTYRSTPTSVADSASSSSETATNNTKKRSTASDFVSPLGVNEKTYTTTNIQRGSIITTVLMCIAFMAAAIGIFFFILAKRRDAEDEDEIQEV